jgi:NTP pyrophosphatase (non-canonical NTP hydrolase)
MNKFQRVRMKDEQSQEIMLIAQEECAEVTQAISKVFRFGIDAEHNGASNRDRLEEEIGDLLCMFDLMVEKEIIDMVAVLDAKQRKLEKLKIWSGIV